MRSIGIMQGRLTQPKGRGIQFFPFDNWIEEFKVAKEIGLKEIEFIFDYDNYKENPLWQDEGQSVKNYRMKRVFRLNRSVLTIL